MTKPTCSVMKALLHIAVRLLKLYLQLLKDTNLKEKKEGKFREHHVTACLTLKQNDMMYNEEYPRTVRMHFTVSSAGRLSMALEFSRKYQVQSVGYLVQLKVGIVA